MIPPKRRLDTSFDTPRRLNALGQGYTWFVRIARYALPVIAIVIIGIVVARLSMDHETADITDIPKDTKTAAGQIELEKAQYEGTDSKGRPYTLTADAASRDPALPDTVILTKPQADIETGEKQWLGISGGTGSFDTKTNMLTLADGVKIFHDSGNEIHLQDITLDIKTSEGKSDKPVTAQGPLGQLSAQNVQILDGGDMIVFGGAATMTLYSVTPKKGTKG